MVTFNPSLLDSLEAVEARRLVVAVIRRVSVRFGVCEVGTRRAIRYGLYFFDRTGDVENAINLGIEIAVAERDRAGRANVPKPSSRKMLWVAIASFVAAGLALAAMVTSP